jgi:hypothetical protein
MNIRHLILELQQFDPNLKVQVKTYGCGCDSWTDLDASMIVEEKNDESESVLQITADWN